MLLGSLRWPQVAELTGKVVVVPLGSIEQHGRHLPLLTDTVIITEVSRRAQDATSDEALFLPPLWIGASDHHLAFPGTVSIANDRYVGIIEDLVESLIGGGFRRIFLLNGHGGNIVPAQQGLYNVQRRHRGDPALFLVLSNWWTLAADRIASIEALRSKLVTHACELETSMVLCLEPRHVAMEEARGAAHRFGSRFYDPDFGGHGRVEVARTFEQITRSGALGHPEVATAEKGEALLAAAAAEAVAFIREFASWPPIEAA